MNRTATQDIADQQSAADYDKYEPDQDDLVEQ